MIFDVSGVWACVKIAFALQYESCTAVLHRVDSFCAQSEAASSREAGDLAFPVV